MRRLGTQLDELAQGWDEDLSHELVTLVVEMPAPLSDAGLPLTPGTGPEGACS